MAESLESNMPKYPYLKTKIVVVEGPAAYGIYDLNAGRFQRVNTTAGALLRKLRGTEAIDSFDINERRFLQACDSEGYISWQDHPETKQQTGLAEVVREVRPVRFAWIELTSKCNQFCKHCFLGEDLNAYPHYTKAEVYEMLATLNAVGARQIILSGGEPVSHPEFREILDYAGREYPFKLTLLTNGSHQNIIAVIDLLVKYDVTVKIPLLGWHETHNAMAGIRNGFAQTIATIQRLSDEGVPVQLGTTVTGLNHEDIPKIREYADRMGLPLEVSPLYAVGYAMTNRSQLYSISQEQIIETCRTDKKRTALVPITLKTVQKQPPPVQASTERYGGEATDYDAVDLRDYLTAHSECGQKIIAILSSREVTPCLMLRDKKHSLGSLRDNSLEEILAHSAPQAAAFDELMSLGKVPGCRDCEARFVCKAGGCPASAQAFAGSVQVKNPLFRKCYYANPMTREEVGLAAL